MATDLKLSGNDLFVYMIIYSFSKDGQGRFFGSLKYLQECLGISKPTVIKSLKSLIEKDLIEKKSKEINGMTLNEYKVILWGCKETLPGVKDFNQGSKETLPGGSKETLPNKKLIDNKEYNKGENELFPSLNPNKKTLFSNSLLAKFETFESHFKQNEFEGVDLNYYFQMVNNWSDQKNMKRTAKGWVATARTWMLKDNKAGKLERLTTKETDDYEDYLKMNNGG